MESVEIVLGLANPALELPLAVGETFDIAFTANDLRADGRPIAFSLYTDVNFDPEVLKATNITYNDNPANLAFYTQAQTGEIDNDAGIINEVGATSSLTSPFPGTSPVVFTVTFEVLKSEPFTITTDAGEALLSQTVAYGLDNDQRDNVKYGTFAVDGPPPPVNQSPVAAVDSAIGNEDTIITGNVLANDTDIDGDDLTASLESDSSNGSVVLNADGSFEYTPNPNFNGSDSFTYTVSDGELSDTGTVNITVTAVNDAPVAVNDSGDTIEDTATTVNVLSNDIDLDGDTLSVASASDGSNGTVAVNGDGTIEYTPEAGFSGTDSFTYTVSDGELSDEGTVTVSVGAVNKVPVAVVDSVVGDEDTVLTGSVLGNDTDADGDTLSAVLASEPANGSVIFNADGSFEYTPNANFNGNDSFTYTVSDGELSDVGTVNITVNAVNDAPVATNDSGNTVEDTAVTINVLNDDTDIDGDTLSVSAVSDGNNGTVTINGDGTVEYAPEAGFSGTDSFTYTVSDGELSDEGTVTVSVGAVNKSPVAVVDSVTGNEDTAITGNVLDNDLDTDGDELTAVLASDPSNGVVVLNVDGSFEYTPNANFSGSDSFTYTVSDGELTDIGTVNIEVSAVNDAPVATDDSGNTVEDTAVTINVLNDDTDVDGDTLSVSAVSDGNNGTATINGDGTVEYTPETGFSGTDSFTYTVSDGELSDEGTVTVSVGAVNKSPVAVVDSVKGEEDTLITGNVLENDTDDDGDTLSAALSSEPTNGIVVLNTDGSFEYTPNANFNGSDSFTYTVSDGELTDAGTVNITVDAVNDAPVAVDDSSDTLEETAVTINVLSDDTDIDGDTLSVSAVTDGSNGTVTINGDGTLEYTPEAGFSGTDGFTYTVSDGELSDEGTVTVSVGAVNKSPVAVVDSVVGAEDTTIVGNALTNDTDADGDDLTAALASEAANGSVTFNADGSFEYTPNADFNGSDSFTYTVSDGELSDTGTVNVTVVAVNDAPAATNDSGSTSENEAVEINVLTNDTDVDGDTLGVSAVGLASNGTVVIGDGGVVEYTPDEGFSGSDSFSYTVSDGEFSDTATVSVTVESIGTVNEAPVAVGDSFSGDEDTVIAGNVLANDTDADEDDLTATLGNGPTNGSVTLNTDGSFEYIPDADFNGSDSFSYVVSDGELTDTAIVELTVNPVNDSPIASNDNANTNVNQVVDISVVNNDTDVDGDSLSVSDVTAAANGNVTITRSGSVAYTPNAGFSGSDSFTYTVTDGELTDSATVNVSVKAAPTNGDKITGDDGNNRLIGTSGNDFISGEGGNDNILGLGGNDRLFGDDGNDRILGGDGNDNIVGGEGNDRLLGGGGNDRILGNSGNDRILGNDGNDRLFGNDGNDNILGGDGNDRILGGEGSDRLLGGEGNDNILGGGDDDVIIGGNGKNRLLGGGGNDRIFGGSERDVILGNSGNDTLFGDAEDDIINGGAGDDVIFGEAGNDTLIGGQGADQFVLRAGQGTDVIRDFEQGIDLIGLSGGLKFGALDITQRGNNAFISFGDETLARVSGVSTLTEADFTRA